MGDFTAVCMVCRRPVEMEEVRAVQVARCAACRLAFQLFPPADTHERYRRVLYDRWQTDRGRPPAHTRFHHDVAVAWQRLRQLADHLPPGGVWLDYGCGNGAMLAVARQAGFAPLGVELCKDYAEELATNLLVETLPSVRLLGIPHRPADVISLFDAVAYVLDPVGLLHCLHRWLDDRGVLVIETPDLDAATYGLDGWHHYRPDEHLSYWSETAFRRLVAPGGALEGRLVLTHVGRPLPDKLQVVFQRA